MRCCGGRSRGREAAAHVVTKVDALLDGEVVPRLQQQLLEGVGGHKLRVGLARMIEHVFALQQVLRLRRKPHEGRLRTGALLRGGRREQLGGELFEELEVHAV